MKLIEIKSPIGETLLPQIVLLTDSSITTNGRPVFLPEFSEKWECRLAPAFRIGRLGKTIARRFAHRYVDAIAPAARIIPTDLVDKGYGLSPWATAFDGAVSLGRFVNNEAPGNFTACLPHGNKADINVNYWDIDTTIELISRYFILKNGDIIIPYGPDISFPVTFDTKIIVEAQGGQELMNFNIK